MRLPTEKIWKKYLILFGIELVQIAFLPHPNLALFYVLLSQNLILAFSGGFILDLYSPWPFGINMLVFTALTMLFDYLSRKLFKRNYLYYLIIGLISISYNFLFNALFA
ncbi:MAG: hypothetical protein COX44_03250 [Candidatus Portnoybacteria bacterium CG23_combo_of_CG06-09_8_20_14_all_37_13]|uniref:Rod shape-determining protein MreD n=2 Tax=Parcubacteria group TaxID=1794811 RepID=A0A1J4TYD5_9BACT|nr:MAG: hypothetical protein AUJ29_03180 [Candidatus Kuenenbacteria bacterium CG1_02_38_13]PIP16825.1 MAG: hypothetical protein COX44_03250 [Candidatus Portnoybacteria bacterium CG23_combo_of_CG06-09_8_20_14_all_37_13]